MEQKPDPIRSEGRHEREHGRWAFTASSQFKYDLVNDVYVCPAGATPTYRFATYELGRELKYLPGQRGCRQCALKSRCTRDYKANRTIATREENEHLMEAMAGTKCGRSRESSSCERRFAEHPFQERLQARSLVIRTFLLSGTGEGAVQSGT